PRRPRCYRGRPRVGAVCRPAVRSPNKWRQPLLVRLRAEPPPALDVVHAAVVARAVRVCLVPAAARCAADTTAIRAVVAAATAVGVTQRLSVRARADDPASAPAGAARAGIHAGERRAPDGIAPTTTCAGPRAVTTAARATARMGARVLGEQSEPRASQ